MRSCNRSVRHSEPVSSRSTRQRCARPRGKRCQSLRIRSRVVARVSARKTHAAVCGIETLDDVAEEDCCCCLAASVCWCTAGISKARSAGVGVGVGIAPWNVVAPARVTAQARLQAILASRFGRDRAMGCCFPVVSPLQQRGSERRETISMNQPSLCTGLRYSLRGPSLSLAIGSLCATIECALEQGSCKEVLSRAELLSLFPPVETCDASPHARVPPKSRQPRLKRTGLDTSNQERRQLGNRPAAPPPRYSDFEGKRTDLVWPSSHRPSLPLALPRHNAIRYRVTLESLRRRILVRPTSRRDC